jgi:S-adenosyl-L-methionine hydrolase (adenosine-forming)
MGSVITLLTDFGMGSYVAQMKGVILRLAPHATLVDIMHQIPPADIEQAAWILRDTYRAYPMGTIHLVVVDPGVGSQRKLISLRERGMFFLAPDNGVLTHVMADAKTTEGDSCRALNQELCGVEAPSRVFHGRDILAPIAARLASGIPWESCGALISDPVKLPGDLPHRKDTTMVGKIVYIDNFGNCVTNIPALSIDHEIATFQPSRFWVQVGKHQLLGLKSHYAEVEERQSRFLFGSCGRLEIAVRNGNAAEALGLQRNTAVEIHW